MCDPPDFPECPEAVDIPANYGIQAYCGDPKFLFSPWHLMQEVRAPDGRTIGAIDNGRKFSDGLFKVTRVQAKKRYKWNNGGIFEAGWWDYWHAGIIDYTVICENGITYKDSFGWERLDHTCQSNCSGAAENPDVWHDVPVSNFSYKSGMIETNDGDYPLTLPEEEIVNKWVGRYVGYPPYLGGTHKLAVPLILINGLGFDYRIWGAVPSSIEGTESWTKGLVKDYAQGSLPDVVSRAYGLAKDTAINNNGIYFLNVHPDFDFKSVTEMTQLLNRLGEIIVQHAGGAKNVFPSFQVDLVCHSAGCLLLNEAIARANEYAPIYGFHPVNHIRKIISIDAPNKGTALGFSVSKLNALNSPEYGGLAALLGQIDHTNDDIVLSTTIDLDFSAMAWLAGSNSNVDVLGVDVSGLIGAYAWMQGQEQDMQQSVNSAFGAWDMSKWPVELRGGLFGPHYAYYQDVNISNSDTLVAIRKKLKTQQGMAQKIQDSLLALRVGVNPPQYPNGKYIDYTPFYSDDVSETLVELASQFGVGSFEDICRGNSDPNCMDIQKYAKGMISDKVSALIGKDSYDISDVELAPWFNQMLKDLRNGWLSHSDMVVEKSSQTWGIDDGFLDPKTNINVPQIHNSRTYDLHYAEVPKGYPGHSVIHAPLRDLSQAVPKSLKFANSGAPLVGRDIFCALENACQELTANGRPPIYLGSAVKSILPVKLLGMYDALAVYSQAVDLIGDFNLYLQILSGNQSGVALQTETGTTLAIVSYDPKNGTILWVDGPNGGTITVLLPPDHRPQFALSRNGDSVSVALNLQNGSQTKVSLGKYTNRVATILALGDGLKTTPAYLLGYANVAPQSIQKPMIPFGSVKPYIQERGKKELNQSRPWMWVSNSTDSVIRNMSLTYYFTADSARYPKVEMDHPRNIPLTQEYLGNKQWSFTVLIPEIPAKSIFPQEGLQIRVHYGDWTPWSYSSAYSAGTIFPMVNENILIKDSLGRIVWGSAPELSMPLFMKTVDSVKSDTTRGVAALSVEFSDASPESNVIRPAGMIKNMDSLIGIDKGFSLTVEFDFPDSLKSQLVLEDWYSPDCSAKLSVLPNGHVSVVWEFDQFSLLPGRSVALGDWGIHVGNDWKQFNKSEIRYSYVLRDASNVIVKASP